MGDEHERALGARASPASATTLQVSCQGSRRRNQCVPPRDVVVHRGGGDRRGRRGPSARRPRSAAMPPAAGERRLADRRPPVGAVRALVLDPRARPELAAGAPRSTPPPRARPPTRTGARSPRSGVPWPRSGRGRAPRPRSLVDAVASPHGASVPPPAGDAIALALLLAAAARDARRDGLRREPRGQARVTAGEGALCPARRAARARAEPARQEPAGAGTPEVARVDCPDGADTDPGSILHCRALDSSGVSSACCPSSSSATGSRRGSSRPRPP